MVQEFSVHDFGCPILSCDVTTLRCPSGRRQGSNSGVKYSSAGMSNASSCGMDGSDMSENREEEDAVRGVELESESESYGGGGGVESCLFIACLGDTAGIVSVWILAGSIVPCGPNDSTW